MRFLSVEGFTDNGGVRHSAMRYHAVQTAVRPATPVHPVKVKIPPKSQRNNQPMPAEVVLRHMKKNQKGTIKAVTVAGELGRRIREMGLTPGTEISVCGRAPLRDPVAIRVLNSILTLRNNEAEHIHVEVNE